MPDDAIAALRQQPIWSRLAAMTPSWIREIRAIDQFGSDLKRFRAVSVPVLLIVGEASPPWLTDISRRLALVLPDAELAEIPGQAHDAHVFDAAAMGAKIAEFAL
jgi:pimeloyl-ACP methyl ester carboxylesterase